MELPPLNKNKTAKEPEQQEVKIIKFIEEWSLYPDGTLYFRKKFPIGRIAREYKSKARKKTNVTMELDEIKTEELI